MLGGCAGERAANVTRRDARENREAARILEIVRDPVGDAVGMPPEVGELVRW